MTDVHLEQRAFTSEKVRALTGLTPRQLQYWDERRFLSPSLRRRRGKGRRRLYDFRDLVSLRVAADLRREGVPLQLIRGAVEHLCGLDYQHPLSEVRFWHENGKLYFEESGTIREARRPAQTIAWFQVPLREILAELEQGLSISIGANTVRWSADVESSLMSLFAAWSPRFPALDSRSWDAN